MRGDDKVDSTGDGALDVAVSVKEQTLINLRRRWVGVQVNVVDGEDVVGWVRAVEERVLAWNWKRIFVDVDGVAKDRRECNG